MTRQQQTILTCLQINLDEAKTAAMRDFCRERIADFQKSIARRNRKPATPPKAFTRFLSSFD